MPTFNSAEYSWADVKVVVLGKEIKGIAGVTYKVSQEKEVIYGAGNEPRGMARGNKSYEGELVLRQSELESLKNAAGKGKDITDLAGFDIVIAYIPERGGQIVTDVVKYAEFTEVEKKMAQNDKKMEITLPFIALGIEKNI
jgi:hypothetical protein